jgi:glycogen synthase
LPEPYEACSNHQPHKHSFMRVLMFGWEFPPHISGGLGTACFGLTQSLALENVNLMFVVPRFHGSETPGKVRLINASEVRLPLPSQPGTVTADQHQEKKTGTIRTVHTSTSARPEKSTGTLSYIEVEAALDPYSMPLKHAKSHAVERWNYVFHETTTTHTADSDLKEEKIPIKIPAGYTYDFSGNYGEGLMEEVDQYALVGAELAKQNEHDVIHAHDWMTFGAGIAAKKTSGKPLIVHVHATEYDRSGWLGGPVFDWEKRGMEAADRVVAVSQWTKDILVNKYGIAADKIEVVHNGIIASEEEVPAASSPLGSYVVTFLGRITHQKGPRYFVEAARKVVDKFPDAHFIVAGSGDQLPQTIERVAQLRLSEKFHFTGFLNKEWINRIWSMSNVYVMPSVSEPFGITPLEAIQAGVPVIVSNQSGVAEVMPHALKVNFWDTDALAESICSVLKYKSLSTMLKAKGEKEIKQLSWKKAAVKLKCLYEELTLTLC